MTHAIVQEFERYATLTTNAGYWLEITKPEAAAAAEVFCAEIRELMAAKPDFFAHFDYGWAAEAENYAHPLEAQLQFGMLLIISEIAPSHPDYKKLGNICVRTLGSRHINTEAVVRGVYKYIVIATSMIRLMQCWAVTVRKVAEIGRNAPDDVAVICVEDFLSGQQLERAVRLNWAATTPYIDYLIDTCVSYRIGKIPERSFALTETLDESFFRAVMFLFVGEMFFVCHEIIHLLKHEDAPGERSEREELEADHFAASLFIIFQSHLTRWYGRGGSSALQLDPMLMGAVFTGPAIFFMVLHTLLLVEQPTLASLETVDAAQIAVVKREFDLNRLRMRAYQKALDEYRLGGHGPVYLASLQQLDVIAVACRMRLAERLQIPVQISLDRNLFRGFPEGG